MPKRERISCPQMPLAVYRETAAHLQQVLGVKVALLPQSSSTFAYLQSQIAGLEIDYPENCDRDRQQQIEAILAYYAEHHGAWERQDLKIESEI
ncbi:MAG: hypothetical protein J7647_08675 [Cyanobacteria bacterium SBLK]|nr:hypothetical protein [Cyanobacteria bacterium SBLK]